MYMMLIAKYEGKLCHLATLRTDILHAAKTFILNWSRIACTVVSSMLEFALVLF